jgi:hypothetical protein
MSTAAYADLMFAWAAARLGDAGHAAEWRAPAIAALTATGDPVHQWLASAFAFRIDEALAGRAHGGDWPRPVQEGYARLPRYEGSGTLLPRYLANNLRSQSRCLEPDFLVNPYEDWMKYGNALHRLQEMREDAGREVISREFMELLDLTAGGDDPAPHLSVLRTAAAWARHLDSAAADRVLTAAAELLPQYLWARMEGELQHHLVWLAGTSCFLAVVHRRDDFVRGLANRVMDWLRRGSPEAGQFVGQRLYLNALQSLRRLNLPAEAAALLDAEAETGGRLSAGFDTAERLQVAGVGWWLGRREAADRIFGAARVELQSPPRDIRQMMQYVRTAAAFVSAVGTGQIAEFEPMLTTFVSGIPRVPAGFTTASHYSRAHLCVTEAVALALATDDFSSVPDLHTRLGSDEVAGRRELLPRLRDAIHAWGSADWR